MIFDLLRIEGRNLLDEPLTERKKVIEDLEWARRLRSAPFMLSGERVELDPLFQQAASRRNEGSDAKRCRFALSSRQARHELVEMEESRSATLDVVVTGVEFGHGRRRDVLSDYTFAIQGDGKLLNIGKAYSGLTDLEIAEMTEFFKQHTLRDHGRFRLVEPVVVIEVAFNGIQKSGRHASGYALRFPRIVRIRTDKTVADIDGVETVRKLYSRHAGI